MPKNKLLLLAVPVIVLAVYNIFMFSLFGTASPKFLPAYLFTTAAVLLSSLSIGICISGKNLTVRDMFTAWPLIYVSCAYAVIQIILSFLIMAFPFFGTVAANLVQALLLAIYAILAVSAIFGANIAEDIDKKQAAGTSFVRVLTGDIEALVARAKDPKAKRTLGKLCETARYSDPVSHDTLSALENSISAKVSELSPAISSGEGVSALCEEITLLLGERNSKCKFLK
jgi:hypothetical protein